MLVLLTLSERKHGGGTGPPLDLDALCLPELTPVRSRLVNTLVQLAADPPMARAALGLSPGQDGELARNAALRTGATAPALERYTGVLYDALDVRSMTVAERTRASRRLAVASALFGLVRAEDPIPAYRLSAGSALPGLPALRALWRPALTSAMEAVDDLVVDLRSGAYARLGPVDGAVTVDVLSARPGGTRVVVSHANKGRLARLLATTRAEPGSALDVRRLLRRAGWQVEAGPGEVLRVVVSGDIRGRGT